MSEVKEIAELFELELDLPNAGIAASAKRLVGFENRYQKLHRALRLLADPEELRAWSRKYHHQELAVCSAVSDRYPLVIFAGDVGTGKTVTAEGACDRLARDARKEAMLFKLSTRVRGSGKVGQMSTLLNQAFDVVAKQAGKTRQAFLIIDEGDSLASTRDTVQSHHEDKVAVNTIIQKVDDLRRHSGRILVFLCTNRAGALDPAIVRRAAVSEQFDRPTDQEREELFRMDLGGLTIKDQTLRELVRLTGPRDGRPGLTFSDLRSKLLPDALCRAFPSRGLTEDDLIAAAKEVRPSPVVGNG
ncbi:MAG: ATPase, central domain protein [Acidobacteriaceae bacterium]|nr:ATPase, central domain protein [Acidobacteriaceae bacterium]